MLAPTFEAVTVGAEDAGVTGLDWPELGVVVTLGPLNMLVEPDALTGVVSFGGQAEFVVNKLPSDGLTG